MVAGGGGGTPWWLTVLAMMGPLAGLFAGDRLTRRRDERQHRLTALQDAARARRATQDRDREERRRGYLDLYRAGTALAAAIADKRAEEGLTALREAATASRFSAAGPVVPLVDELVAAGQRWAKVTAANAPASAVVGDCSRAFGEKLARLHDAMRADLA